MNRRQRDDLIELANAGIAETGCECLEVEWDSASRTLRLFVDRAGGITVDHCATVSRMLDTNAALESVIDGAFNLEVSSPGVDRPLRKLEHFASAVGGTVDVKLAVAADGRKHGIGKLQAVDGQDLLIETSRGLWRAPWVQLDRAHIVFDWENWAPEPAPAP